MFLIIFCTSGTPSILPTTALMWRSTPWPKRSNPSCPLAPRSKSRDWHCACCTLLHTTIIVPELNARCLYCKSLKTAPNDLLSRMYLKTLLCMFLFSSSISYLTSLHDFSTVLRHIFLLFKTQNPLYHIFS